MPTIHYLNVKQGDCSLIQHYSNRVAMIDVCNAKAESPEEAIVSEALRKSALGDFNREKYPGNPTGFMKERNVSAVFRFILTNPDMDHMDGIKEFFGEFSPANFLDTNNNVERDFGEGSPYHEDDWQFYKFPSSRPATRYAPGAYVTGTGATRGEPPSQRVDVIYPLTVGADAVITIRIWPSISAGGSRQTHAHPHPGLLPRRGRGNHSDPLAPGGGEGQGEGAHSTS